MTANRKAAIGFFVLGLLCLAAGQWLKLGGWLGVLGLVVEMFAMSAFWRGVVNDRNRNAIDSALDDLDVIHDGFRVIGRDAEVVDWRRADRPREPGPIEVVQLCRTKKKQWFEHRFALDPRGRIVGRSIRFLNEEGARAWLSYDVETYERVFGQVELA